MSRKTDPGPSGREARRLADEFFRRGMLLRARDSHRGDNEGLDDRVIRAFAEENAAPYGRKLAEQVIRQRCRQAGYDC